MGKLDYTFKTDTLFKILFVKYPDLLKRLVAELLGIQLSSIGEFTIINTEMPPEAMSEKFCRLDIHMTVNGQHVDLEVQVNNENDYPERTLFYWARDYSTALGTGQEYIKLPRTVIISIINFELFDCEEFHSQFEALEVTRHTRLTDRMCLHYFELPKVPFSDSVGNELKLWLSLFKADTEEELTRLEELEVPFVEQAITAYRSIIATDEFKELERLRELARHNEASALANARREADKAATEREGRKWQSVIKDERVANQAALAAKDAANQAALAAKDAANQAALAAKDAELAKLKSLLGRDIKSSEY